MIKEIVKNRRMLFELAKSDFKKRFAGSYFGIAWMFIQPVATVLVFFLIFQLGMKSQPPVPGTPYVIWLIPGLVPWFFFSETLSLSTTVFQEYSYLVKKVVFPVEFLPVIKVMSCFFVHACFVVIMLIVFLISGRMPQASWVGIVYYSIACAVLSLGISLITASVFVFFRDMQNIVAIILQFGMWLAPIMYWEGIFTVSHPWLLYVFKANPFYYIVAGYRDSMLTGNFFWERPLLTLYYWVVVIVIGYLGLRIFRKLRPHFSDVL